MGCHYMAVITLVVVITAIRESGEVAAYGGRWFALHQWKSMLNVSERGAGGWQSLQVTD